MNSISKVAAMGLLVWVGLNTGVAADSAQSEYRETVELTFPLNSGGTFSLDNRNGALEFETWDSNEVKIVAEKRMRLEDSAVSWLWRVLGLKAAEVKTDEDAKKLFAALVVESSGDADKRDVRTIYPEDTTGINFSVSYRVTAPRNVDVRANLTNGAIELEGVTGDIDVQSVNGAVSIADVSGRTEARSTNGRITIEGASGEVVGRTTNGSVTAYVTGEGAGDVELKSVNGSVTLYTPEGTAFRLEGRTTHGSVSSELALDQIDEQSRKELRGSAGQGGPLFSLRTTNGSVRVKKD